MSLDALTGRNTYRNIVAYLYRPRVRACFLPAQPQIFFNKNSPRVNKKSLVYSSLMRLIRNKIWSILEKPPSSETNLTLATPRPSVCSSGLMVYQHSGGSPVQTPEFSRTSALDWLRLQSVQDRSTVVFCLRFLHEQKKVCQPGFEPETFCAEVHLLSH